MYLLRLCYCRFGEAPATNIKNGESIRRRLAAQDLAVLRGRPTDPGRDRATIPCKCSLCWETSRAQETHRAGRTHSSPSWTQTQVYPVDPGTAAELAEEPAGSHAEGGCRGNWSKKNACTAASFQSGTRWEKWGCVLKKVGLCRRARFAAGAAATPSVSAENKPDRGLAVGVCR